MTVSAYEDVVLRELARDRFVDLYDNYDGVQLGEEPIPPRPIYWDYLAEARKTWRGSQSLGDKLGAMQKLARAMQFIASPHAYFRQTQAGAIAQGEYLFNLLGDQESRDLLVKLMAYRILGHRKVRLPRNTRQYWDDIDRARSTRTDDEPLRIKFMDTALAMHDLNPLGFDIKCYATGPGVACTVLQKQYEYCSGSVRCKAEPGDIVIDAGGCWGDTSLHFAHEVGAGGKVVVFEFIPSNLAVLKRNVSCNPHLRAHIAVVERPIWSFPGLKLYYVDWGPGSRVTSDIEKYHSWEGVVETTTIDETLERLALPRVDFIKMDIEGAELDSLRGAERSIRLHRPKLAISLYHNPEDFETIPRYLNELDIGYRFYLEHHTIYLNETVLFAVPG